MVAFHGHRDNNDQLMDFLKVFWVRKVSKLSDYQHAKLNELSAALKTVDLAEMADKTTTVTFHFLLYLLCL